MNDERATLIAAAAALGLPLDRIACERLIGYLALLRKWNRVYNLTSVRDPQQMLLRHLIDSLAAVPPLARELAHRGDAARLLDMGSGAGLPGVVFAICRPALMVDCIDAVAKKCAFVRQAAAELALANLNAIHARVESLPPCAPGAAYDVISARAFATLAELAAVSSHLLAPSGVWLAMKGKVPQHEIDLLPASIHMFHVEHLAVPGLDERRCIVWMRKKCA